jgi:hypothetical protein
MVALMVGVGESAIRRSLELGGRFCVGFFKNLASVAVKMFSYEIYLKINLKKISYFQCDMER